jgi:hypothetical protein
MNYVPPPDFEKQLWDDILTKRNQHLLKIIESRLTLSDTIVVPWGAAHMPGLAKQIEKMGFHQEENRKDGIPPRGIEGLRRDSLRSAPKSKPSRWQRPLSASDELIRQFSSICYDAASSTSL